MKEVKEKEIHWKFRRAQLLTPRLNPFSLFTGSMENGFIIRGVILKAEISSNFCNL